MRLDLHLTNLTGKLAFSQPACFSARFGLGGGGLLEREKGIGAGDNANIQSFFDTLIMKIKYNVACFIADFNEPCIN